MRKILISLILMAIGNPVWGAIPKSVKTMERPSSIIAGIGAVSGGQSAGNLALMDFRRTYSKKAKVERLVMDFSGPDMKPQKGLAGYYHVEVSYNPKRLTVDLPQILSSKMSETEILRRVKGSPYIENGMLNFDRTSQTMQLILQLKTAVNVRVLQVKNPKVVGKLVLDIGPYKKQ